MDFLQDIGFPGECPFTRGPYPEMSRHRPWHYALFTGVDTPEKTNERWKFLYKTGQPTFNVLYDLPSHQGLDADDPLAGSYYVEWLKNRTEEAIGGKMKM